MIDQLIGKIIATENPTVVGLDPRLSMIPSYIRDKAFAAHGETLEGAAAAILAFNKEIIDATYDLIPAVKPQIALYECFGTPGVQAFIDTVAYAKSKGLVIIGDIKRGDIASTAQAYAEGHIGEVRVGSNAYKPFDEDFITLNPYMGEESVSPYFPLLKKYNKGLFLLVRTSNAGSGQIQDQPAGADGRPLYEMVGELVSKWGDEFIGKYGFSSVGAVVGATYPEQGRRLRERLPHVFFLVPGYGAQGATAKDLAGCFNDKGLGAIVNSSRGIIGAWQMEKYKDTFTREEEFALASRQAVLDMKADLQQALNA